MKKKKIFLVSLHVFKLQQAVEEAAKVLGLDKAHGVLLVNHEGDLSSDNAVYPNLFDVALEIKKLHPDSLVGVNPLDMDTRSSMTAMPEGLDILWKDKGGIIESGEKAFLDENLVKPLERLPCLYYGSELFKYRTPPKNPELVARAAAKHFGAFITSGKATGSKPEVAEIKMIRDWIGPDATLGIASGMDAETIEQYLPFADIFIVATSFHPVEKNILNMWKYVPEKVQAFRAKIDGWENTKSAQL